MEAGTIRVWDGGEQRFLAFVVPGLLRLSAQFLQDIEKSAAMVITKLH